MSCDRPARAVDTGLLQIHILGLGGQQVALQRESSSAQGQPFQSPEEKSRPLEWKSKYFITM